MSYTKILLWCIVLSMAITGNLVAQNRASSDGIQAGGKAPLIWNFHKLQKWYENHGLMLRHDAAIVPPRTVPLAALPPDEPDVQVFPSSNHETENSIAVSQSNPLNLMVTVNELNSQPAWFSTNGGASWFGNESDPGGAANFGDPVALFDLSGAAYWVTLASPGGVGVGRTTDFGTTWTITNADPLSSSNDDKEHAMVDQSGVYPNNMYAAWTDFNVGSGTVVLTRSTNSGSTWSARTSFALSGAAGQGTNIATGPNGEVYLTFAALNGSTLPESGIAQAKSTDGGATWSAARVLFPINGIRVVNTGQSRFNNTRAPSFPSTAVDRSAGPRRGWVYVAYSGDVTSSHTDADIYLSRSTDGGATYNTPIRVNTEAPGSQQWMPGLAVDPTTGGISLGYYSMDTTVQYLTARYVASSNDGGDTWQYTRVSDVRFTPSPLPPPYAGGYCGDYYETASYGGKGWACWSDNRINSIFNAYVSRLLYAENFGWVKGTITNVSGGAQLPGVAVDFTDPILQQGGTSNAAGLYLAGAKVDTPATTRNVTLRARKFGFRDTLIALTITRNDTVTHNFAMTPVPNGTLVVRTVRTDSSNISSGITVLFNGGTVASGNTDSLTGIFSTVLPLGSYDVLVDPPSPYGNRRFNSVAITTGSNPLYVVVRAIVENSPAAMRDTLAVGQVHAKTLVLTNTSSDTVPYRLSDDNTLARMRLSRPAVQPRTVKIPGVVRPKGSPDPGPSRIDSSGGPDAFGYRFIDSDSPGGPIFNWFNIDTAGRGTAITFSNNDDGNTAVPLAIPFPFYGNNYSTAVNVCTNGWMSFTSTSTEYSNTTIPTSAAPNDAIYAFWDDLNVISGATVKYYYDVPNTRFIVQWTNVPSFSGTGTGTWQVILYPNGQIIVQYLSVTYSSPSATVGIENADGTVALQVSYNGTYVHDNLAVRYYLPDAPWISENPSFGQINPGGTQNVTVTFDAGTALPGTIYNGKIIMDVTHPDVTGSILIPASLKVNVANTPVIILSKTSLPFPVTEIGTTRRDSLTVRNGGTPSLIVSSISSTNPRFVPTPTSATIVPGDSIRLRVTYTGVGPAHSDTGRVIILSNDPLTPRTDVILSGSSFGVAHVVVRPDTFLFNRSATPDTTYSSFKIFNTGTDTLRYNMKETNTSPLAEARAIERSRTQQHSASVGKGAIDPNPGEGGTDSQGGPDAFGYRWIDSDEPGGPAFNWVDISTVGTQITSWTGTNDDGYATVPFPFSFPFYGTTFSGNINVITNGFLSFTSVLTAYSNLAIPSTTAPFNAVFPFWDDMDLRTSGAVYYYYDVANGRFIVEYLNVPHYTSGELYTFEVIFKPTGTILYQYLTMDPALVNSSTIGVQNADGTVGLQVVYNSNYMHDNLALLITSDIITWMSTNPTEGTILPGDSTSVSLRIHPAGLSGGTYVGYQRITGNTPDTTAKVRVRLAIITGVGEQPKTIPMQFALSQNYPNPFNPTTKIKYDLPEQATVVLKIYNVLGQEVATLANTLQAAGYYEATWNGHNNFGNTVSSGVYFYRFDATGVSGRTFNNLKKMLFLK